MSDKDRGLYAKFKIYRTDGRSERGEKHYRCDYFVLDLSHDPHAAEALAAYARSCAAEFPALADDLENRLVEMERSAIRGNET